MLSSPSKSLQGNWGDSSGKGDTENTKIQYGMWEGETEGARGAGGGWALAEGHLVRMEVDEGQLPKSDEAWDDCWRIKHDTSQRRVSWQRVWWREQRLGVHSIASSSKAVRLFLTQHFSSRLPNRLALIDAASLLMERGEVTSSLMLLEHQYSPLMRNILHVQRTLILD